MVMKYLKLFITRFTKTFPGPYPETNQSSP